MSEIEELKFIEDVDLPQLITPEQMLVTKVSEITNVLGPVQNGAGDSVFKATPQDGIWLGNTAFASAPFRVDMNGNLTATSASISGTLTVTSGTIGGWSINATSIFTGTEDHSGYTAYAGDITIYSDGVDASIHAKNFYIDTAGTLTCQSVYATGTINAQAGYLSAGVYIDTVNGLLCESGGINVGVAGHIRGGQAVYNDSTAGFFLGYDGSDYKFSIGVSMGNYLTWDGSSLDIQGNFVRPSTLFGDGVLGDVTRTASDSFDTDMYYDDLTINAGVILDTNGYRLFVKGTLLNNGTIRNNGGTGGAGADAYAYNGAGTGGTAGDAAPGNYLTIGSTGAAGGAGGLAASTGVAGTNGVTGITIGIGGNGIVGNIGGAGGNTVGGNPGQSGGAGGTAGTISTGPTNKPVTPFQLATMYDVVAGAYPVKYKGSAGSGGSGGGGGSYGNGSCPGAAGGGGGGSGGSGGIVCVYAKEIINNGYIQADGGVGGAGGDGFVGQSFESIYSAGGGGGAGGPGGPGGVMVVVYQKLTGAGTITVAGGVGGAHGDGGAGGGGDAPAGSPGEDGNTGTTGTLLKIQL